MLKIENTDVYGFSNAIRGMRNPLNSWDRSDSFLCTEKEMTNEEIDATCGICPKRSNCDVYDTMPHFIVGPNDLALMEKLSKAGSDHRKFMRTITVYADITAPRYWWIEYDTYKVGTVANSCSTMHTITEKEFTTEDFSCEHLMSGSKLQLRMVIDVLNDARKLYIETHDKAYWWQIIQLLPASYNQRRTVMLNYEVLKNMHHSRKNHKLDEWRTFCEWIETLPYSEIITEEKRA